jgi:hypothetical protein
MRCGNQPRVCSSYLLLISNGALIREGASFTRKVIMSAVPAIYLGQLVSKEHFRTFIYAPDGAQKLVESWEEFEQHMASGLWFDTLEKAKLSIAVEPEPEVQKPKRVRNKSVPVTTLELKEEPFIEEEMIPVPAEDLAFEVKPEDDFLPKASK